MTRWFAMTLLLVAVCCSPSFAAVMSVSTTAPTVDGADIAQLAGLTDPGGNVGHVWRNRPVHGQTFTTGPSAGGYNLAAVSMLARVDQTSTTSPSWNIRVGSVDGTPNFNLVGSETAVGVTIPRAYPGGSAPPPPQWVTWTLGTPITLSPNTLYAFDVDSSGSGFISLNNPGDVYAGGAAFSSGGGGNPANPITLHNFDRVFHADLTAVTAEVIPEPSTILIWSLLAGLGIAAGWRRRKR